MLFARVIIYVLAIALPSLRISPRTWLVAMGILTIALSLTAFIVFYIVYIQSIGSGLEIFSELFNNFLLVPNCALEEISLIFLSLVPVILF